MKARRWRALLSAALFSAGGLSAASALAADDSPPSARRLLGPLVLIKPLSPHTLARLTDEAESLYRFGLHRQSLDAFEAIAELVPGHAQAWLRVGNIQQRLGRRDRAVTAYRKAVASSPASGDEVRRKALFNLGVIHLDEIDKIVTALEALSQPDQGGDAPEHPQADGSPQGRSDASAAAQRLDHLRAARDEAADRMRSNSPAVPVPARGGPAGASSASSP